MRDFPELGLRAFQFNQVEALDKAYNYRIRALTEAVDRNDGVDVVVVGDSFARDWRMFCARIGMG